MSSIQLALSPALATPWNSLTAQKGASSKSPDIVMDGVTWEMKAPESGRASSIQKCLRRALHQSRNVIIDSKRLKTLSDSAVEKELRSLATSFKTLQRLTLVNKSRDVIDIKR